MVKKSICIIATIDFTLEQFVIPSAREFKKKGFEVCLLSSMSNKFITKYQEEFRLINIQMERGIKLLGMLKAIWLFIRIFKNEQFSMVQYSTPNAAFYGSIAGYITGIKIRIYCQWGIRYVGLAGFKRKTFKLIEKITCSLSTHIRPVSQLNLQFAVEEHLYKKSKALVLGKGGAVGIDLNKFNSSKRNQFRNYIIEKHPELLNKKVFGFVGRLEKDKGVNELLSAFKSLLEIYPQIALLIVGFMDKPKNLDQDLLIFAKSCPNIIFTGYSEDIPQYMSSMDILVHPTYREGFGLVILQALAMGTPVITTDIPGAGETIENGISGLLCNAKDVHSLYQQMERLLQDEFLQHRFSEQGKKRIELYFKQEYMSSLITEDRYNLYQQVNNHAHRTWL